MKSIFIQSEIWILTFGGAFQRAKIYDSNIPEEDRIKFRVHLKEFIENKLLPQYKNRVTEKNHLKNIQYLIRHAEKQPHLLKDGKFRYGIAQKVLNLYLKYKWCLNEIKTPPHFPVDRIIQMKMNYKVVNWTKMSDKKEYMDIIKAARIEAQKVNMSLADWELHHFSRRAT